MRLGDYRGALERQLAWLRWESTTEADAMWDDMSRGPSGDGFASSRQKGAISINRATGKVEPATIGMRPDFRRPLLYGDVFFVAPNICDALARKVREDPVPDIVGFDPKWLLARDGFVVLGSPVKIAREVAHMRLARESLETSAPPSEDFTSHITALGWSTLENGVVQVVTYADRYMVTVNDRGIQKMVTAVGGTKNMERIHTALGPDAILAQEQVGYFPFASFAIDPGSSWRAVVRQFADEAHRYGHGYPDDDIAVETPFFYGLTLFMLDRRAVVRHERLPRADRRRADREKEVPTEHIQVVILRAEEEAFEHGRDPSTPPREIDWKWRWPVREHTRRHPVTGLQTVKVREYVKGPADRPLKKADRRRVFAVIR